MAKHKLLSFWGFRWPPSKRPNGVVRTTSEKKIGFLIQHQEGFTDAVTLPRKEARMLAKRILECLEATK